MKRKRLATHRIGMIGPLWQLQEKRKFWFIPYWKTILSSPFYSDCIGKLREINFELFKKELKKAK